MKKDYISYYNLKPGDVIIVPKSAFNLIQHHALYIGYDNHGIHWIIHNTIGVGVSLITTEEFFTRCSHINKIKRFAGTNEKRRSIVENALEKRGKPYNFINYNCEHFISEIKTGKARSTQIENMTAGILLILIIGAFVSD